jgi:class 3 adenylate cyclase
MLAEFESDRLKETKMVVRTISHRIAEPFFCLFWFCDIIFVPHLKWQFLFLRLLVIPICRFTHYKIESVQNLSQAFRIALFYCGSLAAVIHIMLYLIADPTTPYYAGVNLIGLGSLTFIPLNKKYLVAVASVVYLPALMILGLGLYIQNWRTLCVHFFFLISTLLISLIIRYFNEKLRIREFESQMTLRHMVQSQDTIIEQKTTEALSLSEVSKQFSPQVVQSIKDGKLSLTAKVSRAEICALFIDIVNSTERVTRIDKDHVHHAISIFLDDAYKILLKYDITIDKFLGDGILAFCNDPVQHSDYIDRCLSASLEIRKAIKEKEDLYERIWRGPLMIRIGIATGFANVGFYGNARFYKSYTAIGPVINMASRLCSSAEPNQIILDSEVFDLSDHMKFTFNYIGKKSLKGFESDVIHTYDLVDFVETQTNTLNHHWDCPKCQVGLLYLAENAQGILILKCRSCGTESPNSLEIPTVRAAL